MQYVGSSDCSSPTADGAYSDATVIIVILLMTGFIVLIFITVFFAWKFYSKLLNLKPKVISFTNDVDVNLRNLSRVQ